MGTSKSVATTHYYRGRVLAIASDGKFFDCTITHHLTKVQLGGLLASCASTTPELFLEESKRVVDRIDAGKQQFNSAVGGRR
jgi:hypothetical protein